MRPEENCCRVCEETKLVRMSCEECGKAVCDDCRVDLRGELCEECYLRL